MKELITRLHEMPSHIPHTATIAGKPQRKAMEQAADQIEAQQAEITLLQQFHESCILDLYANHGTRSYNRGLKCSIIL